jgi:hypothetical protein
LVLDGWGEKAGVDRRRTEYAPKSNGHAAKAENGSFQES